MCVLRRAVLLWFFMFWQGGFLFYGAIVVAIGSDVLGSDFAQGLITRRVALALNLTGIAVLVDWISDLLVERQTRVRRRWSMWVFLLLTIAVLDRLHPQMDALIDAPNRGFTDHDA